MSFMASLIAISEAVKTDIAYVAIWFVGFPALVTGLIAVAVIRARGERYLDDRHRRREHEHLPYPPP
jgi:hypothetical protein